jgi:hypothetical protein
VLVFNGGAQVSQREGNYQAINWIKKKEGKMLEGRIRTFNDSDFLKQMELAIQYGFPFMFENVDEYIDPVIDPILEKVTVSGPGGRKTVKLGDKDIEWVSSNILSLLSFPSLSRLCGQKHATIAQISSRCQIVHSFISNPICGHMGQTSFYF